MTPPKQQQAEKRKEVRHVESPPSNRPKPSYEDYEQNNADRADLHALILKEICSFDACVLTTAIQTELEKQKADTSVTSVSVLQLKAEELFLNNEVKRETDLIEQLVANFERIKTHFEYELNVLADQLSNDEVKLTASLSKVELKKEIVSQEAKMKELYDLSIRTVKELKGQIENVSMRAVKAEKKAEENRIRAEELEADYELLLSICVEQSIEKDEERKAFEKSLAEVEPLRILEL